MVSSVGRACRLLLVPPKKRKWTRSFSLAARCRASASTACLAASRTALTCGVTCWVLGGYLWGNPSLGLRPRPHLVEQVGKEGVAADALVAEVGGASSHQRPGQKLVLLAWLHVAVRVIVGEHDRCGPPPQRGLDHAPRVHRRTVD